MVTTSYRGRFAPSPTGPLHFGSLVAAIGSYLDARAANGQWLVRMEDVDTTREVPGAADDILRTLDRFGLHWDEEVVYQSRRTALYEAALEQLRAKGIAFSCGCSRRLAATGRCTGQCQGGAAWRVRVPEEEKRVSFVDRAAGEQQQCLATEVGDFVIKRADGLFAYQLAVVVDDGAQHITDVVRGADLLDSTPRQIYLQRALELPELRYKHLPVVVNEQGQKLSKQTRAAAISETPVSEAWWHALRFLGVQPPPELAGAPVETLRGWAVAHYYAP